MARRFYLTVGVLCAALSGCGVTQPVSLSLATGETIQGTAPSVAYTSSLAGERKQDCRASYTGAASSPTVLLELRCSDGRYGIGTGELRNSRLVGGKVRMQDGEEALVRTDGG